MSNTTTYRRWRVRVKYKDGSTVEFHMMYLNQLVSKLEDQDKDYPINITIDKLND